MRLVVRFSGLVGVLLLCNPIGATSYNSLAATGNWAIWVYQKFISPLQGKEICNFSPSCSNFSKQAINKYGMIIGVLMTADRLERCNFSAWSYFDKYYLGIVNGRLYDPIENHYIFSQVSQPRADYSATPLPLPIEYYSKETDFADYLYSEGDYIRAAAEYKRTLFTSPNETVRAYARFMIGESFYKADSFAIALRTFSNCKAEDPARATLYDYEQARTLFALGEYPRSRELATTLTGELAYRAKIIRGWSFFKEKNFSSGAQVFKGDTILGELANFNGKGISSRNRAIATVFSTVIPGLGQTYSGRLGDGLFSFMTVSTFGACAYYYYKKDEPLKFSFLGALALVFWAGNIYGANIAARDYNELKKRDYLARIEAILGLVNLTPPYQNYFR